MLLEVTRTTEVNVSPAVVWALVHDVKRLTGCLPNVSDLRVPVEIELRAIEEPRRIVAGLSGADSRGQARVKGDLEAVVEPNGEGARLTLGMKVEVLGKLATLGAAPMRRRADELFGDFVRRVDAELASDGV